MHRRNYRANKTSRQPSCHIFLDTETYHADVHPCDVAQLHLLRCWCASWVRVVDGQLVAERRYSGTLASEWWECLHLLLSSRRGTWVWCHNSGYDYSVLEGWKEIEEKRLVPRIAVCESHVWILKGRYRGRVFTWVDSLNWLACPLQSVAEWLGRSKVPLPGPDDSLAKWWERCHTDVDILRDGVLRLFRWHAASDLGALQPTIAGQALVAWRHRLGPRVPAEYLSPRQRAAVALDHRPYVWPIVHSSVQALAAERACYYGPTCAVLRLGRVEGPIYELDCTSCYPCLLSDRPYPVRLVSRIDRPPIRRLRSLFQSQGGAASVLVRDTDYDTPYRSEGETRRALGSFRSVLPAPEIRELLERGQIEDCSVLYLYEEREIFAAWTAEVLDLRAAAERVDDHVITHVVKRMANSLHGKIGQRSGQWELTGERDPARPWGEWLHLPACRCPAAAAVECGDRNARHDRDCPAAVPEQRRSLGGHVQRRVPTGESPSSFPLIPAYLCAYARLWMDRLLAIVGPGHTYYVYCDSLHVDEVGYRSLVDAGEVCLHQPGKMRVVAVHDWAHYYAPGRWEGTDERHCAGLSRTHWIAEDGELRQHHFASPAEIIGTRRVDGRPLPGVPVTEQTYRLAESVGDRLVGVDGWTYPRVLSME